MATTKRTLVLLVPFVVLLTSTLIQGKEFQGVVLNLNREIISNGDQDQMGQMTCHAEGNDATLESVSVIWVQVSGEASELLSVTLASPTNSGSFQGIAVNGALERNVAHVYLDQLNTSVCESSYFLCEATYSGVGGGRQRAIATAWPRQPQAPPSDDAASNATRAVDRLEKKLENMTEAFRLLSSAHVDLAQAVKDGQAEQIVLMDRLETLEAKAESLELNQSAVSAVCGNIIDRLAGVEERLQELEGEDDEEQHCEQGMINESNESFVLVQIDSIDKQVRCDTQTDGGGWIVIQRRVNKDVDFNRNWTEYRDGFGDLDGNFWLGNEAVHQLTSQAPYVLRVDMVDAAQAYFAEYSSFKLGNEAANYTLYLGSYSGNTGTTSQSYGLSYSHTLPFSTYDRDNDALDIASCAAKSKGGFWFKACTMANLNSVFSPISLTWTVNSSVVIRLEFVEMKMRRVSRIL